METEPTPIDMSSVPELVRLAEERRTTGRPRVLRHEEDDLAVEIRVAPRGAKRRGKRAPTKAEYEAVLSSAGSWKDVDVDTYASRRLTTRAPVEL